MKLQIERGKEKINSNGGLAIVGAKIRKLFRLDSGNDAGENIVRLKNKADLIIKKRMVSCHFPPV